jgi:hypothetical protein
LAELLNVRIADLLAWKPRAVEAPAAYFREDLELGMPSLAAPVAEGTEDEVDRLFGAGL